MHRFAHDVRAHALTTTTTRDGQSKKGKSSIQQRIEGTGHLGAYTRLTIETLSVPACMKLAAQLRVPNTFVFKSRLPNIVQVQLAREDATTKSLP